VATTVVDSATLGSVKGASGSGTQGHLVYAVNSARWWFFTWIASDINHVRAYVSSSADLSTATWAAATNSTSPGFDVGTIDVSGGNGDPGGFGIFPVDGRQLAVAYASISSTDVVQVFIQNSSHWRHVTCRARLSGSTINWDTTGPTSGFTTGMPGDECAPAAPQGLSMAISTTARWHGVNAQNFAFACGMPATTIDDGTANHDPSWGGTRTSFDGSGGDMWQSAVVALASGFMLAVYTDGTDDGTITADSIRMGALKYAESSSESAWPTTNVGANVPNLSTTSNEPNDWGMVARTTSDVHVVRRNAATVLEQVRYSGHGGSWGAKVTLPTTGLTGQLANGGVSLASDGSSVWCFVIDTDANKSIKYLRWTSGGGWDSSWSTLSGTADGVVKNFVVANMGSSQIGVAWTVNASSPFAVQATALVLATAGFKDVQARYRISVPTAGWRNAGARYVLAPPVTSQPWARVRPASGSLM
jgi:hypothetical protein